MTSPLPLSDVKVRLSEVAEEVARTHERVHVTKNGREYVVLIAADDLASLEATVELLEDPAAQQRIRKAERDLSTGRGVPADKLAESMRRHRGR